jgi:hypothetical protein
MAERQQDLGPSDGICEQVYQEPCRTTGQDSTVRIPPSGLSREQEEVALQPRDLAVDAHLRIQR